MKIIVTFKTPDAVSDAIGDSPMSPENKKIFTKLTEKFVKWGEYVDLEFDTVDETVKVLEQ